MILHPRSCVTSLGDSGTPLHPCVPSHPLPALISLDSATTGSTGGNLPPPTSAGIFCPRPAPGMARAPRGRPRPHPPARKGGEGARAEPGMEVFNYAIKCTIRCNYQRSEGATVHNGLVIYCRHCLYCSAPLPNDYGKLSHLHGCHGNGGLAGARGWRGESLCSRSPPRCPTSPRGVGVLIPALLWGHTEG